MLLFSLARSNVPSPPNVNVTVINCGRRIKLQEKPDWGADSYQVKLTPLNGGSNQTFNVPRSELSDTTFPVNSNTVYDVTVRAKNSAGFSLGTKKQLKTTAGTFKIEEHFLLPILWGGIVAVGVIFRVSLVLCLLLLFTFYFRF